MAVLIVDNVTLDRTGCHDLYEHAALTQMVLTY